MLWPVRLLTIDITILVSMSGNSNGCSGILTTTSLQFPQAFIPCLSQTNVPGIQFEQDGRRTEGAIIVVMQMKINLRNQRNIKTVAVPLRN